MVLEVASFTLVDGTDVDAFLHEHTKFHTDWVATQPGFVKRVTTCGDGGVWKDVVTWESLDAALTAMKTIGGIEEGQAWMSMMDGASINMYHGEIKFEA